jgi:hypothetical protein
VDKLVFTIVILMGILTGMMLSLLMLSSKELPGILGGIALMLFTVLAARFAFIRLFRAVDLYDHGAVERRFTRRSVFRYEDVKSVDHSAVRRHVNFMYVGSVFSMRLTMLDGRTLRIDGHYKPALLGAEITILGRTFKGPTASDVVRDVIEAHIAKRHGESDWPLLESGGREESPKRARPLKKRYYTVSGDREKGPHTVKQLRAALEDGTLTKSTQVRADGEDERQPLGDVLG